MRTLIKQRVDVNAASPDGTTALHWAVKANSRELAQLLIAAGAKANAANRYGVTPLTLAATSGNAALAEALLKAGANPNTTVGEGETILMTAARAGESGQGARRPWRRRERRRAVAGPDGADTRPSRTTPTP